MFSKKYSVLFKYCNWNSVIRKETFEGVIKKTGMQVR